MKIDKAKMREYELNDIKYHVYEEHGASATFNGRSNAVSSPAVASR
jgi:hypothetical protein